MSLKFQITLPEDLAAEMKAAARAQGVPLAQLIRQTMEEKLRRGKAARSQDPFEWLDGLANTDETDLASRVDEILYRDASVH
ncbi:MAG: ribbon-helix-helix domain-containing protein [Acidobacteria bacterium]|nr:ribbon-helix-helix domain-containing protein [Acidobacteriota bacterium]